MKLKTIIPHQNIRLDPIEKIVILNTDSRILDNVIRNIKHKFSQAEIDVAIFSKDLPKIKSNGNVNRLIPLANKTSKSKRLKANNYDLLVIPYPDYVGMGSFYWDLLGIRVGAKYTMVFNANERGFLLTPGVGIGLILRRIIWKFRIIKLVNTLLFILLLPFMSLDVGISKVVEIFCRGNPNSGGVAGIDD